MAKDLTDTILEGLQKNIDEVRAMRESGAGKTVRLKQDITSDGNGFLFREVRRIDSDQEIDPMSVGVTLMGPAKWKDGTAKKLTWVKLAEVGHFRGHNDGEFELTSQTFDEICRNFEARGLPIQFDMDHTSELPSAQIDPLKGTPAHGWAHRLSNRGASGLWGLVEWLDTARDGIKAGQYAFLSPAIRFGSRDTRTGRDIGARLTSVAITNGPFLTGLGRLQAAKDDGRVLGVTELTARLMSDKGLSHADAQAQAAKVLCGGSLYEAGPGKFVLR